MRKPADPRPLARAVTVIVAVWPLAELLLQGASVAVAGETEPLGTNPLSLRLAGLAALLLISSFVLSAIIVGRWIWRVNSNAHALAKGMSITPGWAVGWFFIPFANLVKPFEAMKEAWQVSHDPDNWSSVVVPALLRWWWGFWIISNLSANLSLQLTRNGVHLRLHQLEWLDFLATGTAVGAGASLILLVRRLSAAQARTIAVQAFM